MPPATIPPRRPNKRPVTVLVFGLMAILTAMLVVHAAAVLL